MSSKTCRPVVASALLLLVLAGCGDGNEEIVLLDGGTDRSQDVGGAGNDASTTREDGEAGETGLQGPSVTANVQLQTGFGGGLADAEIAYRNSTTTTDDDGAASVELRADEPFEIVASKSGYWDHRLLGRAGSDDFPYISFVAGEATTSQVFDGVGVTIDDSKGILVVGVDTPQLMPVVGASVTIDAEHDQPITLAGASADADNKIEEGEQGFVSFPNVEPGTTSIDLDPPEGRNCQLYPGGPPRPDFEVKAGTVAVVSFTCEQN